MRTVLAFAAFVFGVFIASVVLTPVLHAFLPFPFERIFRRVQMVAALVGVVALGGFRTGTLAGIGMRWTNGSLRCLWLGALTALPLLAACTVIEVVVGHASLQIRQLTLAGWAVRLVTALATAVAVGVAEEFLFRGFVFTSLRDRLFRGTAWPGMVVTSAAYALVHHLSVPKVPVGASPGLADSLSLALAWPRFVWDWHAAWPSLVGLFLFGMVLNGCAARTRSLYPSIGLHIGAVAYLRMVRLFVRFPSPSSLFWGSYLVYDGVIGWVCLGLMALAARRLFPAEGRCLSGR
ncbi:MAG: CPBP family intramembrane metalloprotease [Vicinamibacterales bacterium]|nr:CPBP family intramembrane metalloprotease [Vicinamibacterales bacterium]